MGRGPVVVFGAVVRDSRMLGLMEFLKWVTEFAPLVLVVGAVVGAWWWIEILKDAGEGEGQREYGTGGEKSERRKPFGSRGEHSEPTFTVKGELASLAPAAPFDSLRFVVVNSPRSPSLPCPFRPGDY